MDFNKIKLTANRKNIKIKLIYDALGMTRQNFDALIKNNSFKVSDIETISRVLRVPVKYWFENSEDLGQISVVEDPKEKYGDIIFLQEQLIVEKQKVLEHLGTIERLSNDLHICRNELRLLKNKKPENLESVKGVTTTTTTKVT